MNATHLHTPLGASPMTNDWTVIRDQQQLGTPWRNIVIEGPGIQAKRRKFWLNWNSDKKKWGNNVCRRDMQKRHPEMLAHLADQMKTTHPKYY